MSVSVVVPFRAGCPHREASWAWVRARYAAVHPGWELVVGESPDGPFNRSAAILDGARKAEGDTLVIADADVWAPLDDAIERCATWAVPHKLVHRLSKDSSDLYMGGSPLEGLELDQSNSQDRRPYTGHATGTLVVFRREVLFDVPPDVRFVGWGHEDDAWKCALNLLVGQPWRGAVDLVHLWHPPQERRSRTVGNPDSLALFNRYKRAARDETRMRALIGEAA